MRTRLLNQSTVVLLFALTAIITSTGVAQVKSQESGTNLLPHGQLENISVFGSSEQVIVNLVADRPISGILTELKTPPYRVFIDLRGIVPKVAPVTAVGRAGVERVRVALNQARPPITRVVLDLTQPLNYQLKNEPAKNEVTIVVGSISSVDNEVHHIQPTALSSLVDDYVSWFETTADTIESMLELARRTDSGTEDKIKASGVLDWQPLWNDLQIRSAPISLQSAHELLTTAVDLAYFGSSLGPLESTTENHRAARSSSALLLEQARNQLLVQLAATSSVADH